ncbi:hypothetical protein KIPB_008660, partial [Kipferlia bialata]
SRLDSACTGPTHETSFH